MTDHSTHFDWWSSLKHDGLLISPGKLAEFFDGESADLPDYQQTLLRDYLTPVLGGETEEVSPFLRTLFEEILGYDEGGWLRHNELGGEWSETLMNDATAKPNWVWQDGKGSVLPVFIAKPSSGLGIKDEDWISKRLGVGRSKRAVSRVLEWMRKSEHDLAVITNGQQLRLVYAGLDYRAWAEWDADLWFEAGEPGDQLTALCKLLHRDTIAKPDADSRSKLEEAIQATREGQAELSDVLGERVRRAVELLIRAVDEGKLQELYADDDVTNQDVYIAACRIIMRVIVILFAEARDLLPRDNQAYNSAYSLESLHEQLEKRAGGRKDRLREDKSAWPRILALFRLVHDGSPHPDLRIPAYGGKLFRPGDGEKGLDRALSVLESPDNQLSDEQVFEILTLLTRTETKIQMGSSKTWIETPIDFSDLSTEYIGIIYEGLLDYELKCADKPMVFLNIGDEPVLPFERLRGMTPDQLADLFDELADGSSASIQTDVERVTVGDDGEDEELSTFWDREAERAEEAEAAHGDDPADREYHEKIFEWAIKAVQIAGLVPEPDEEDGPDYEYKRMVEEKARELVPTDRIFTPGYWYLVRWGGTRKGSGTFYTRPQLVFPTVRRTLEPLCYDDATVWEDSAESEEKTPKPPEEILDLKVCDPAMGSASFLIGALRYLTDALYESLHHHGRLDEDAAGEHTAIRLADGRELTSGDEEPIPVPLDHEDFEDRLSARLKRYVVERCIYGVDIDPLAVELGRMALWIETMDPDLPFGFLDHKLKCGNSLVGAWMDQVRDYPAVAFERSSGNGGDKSHKNGVHFGKNQIGPALEEVRDELMNPLLRDVIKSESVDSFDFMSVEIDPVDVHERLRDILDSLHDLPVHETRERERRYREEVQQNPDFQRLRRIFDTWCAIWFWPFDEIVETADMIEEARENPENVAEKDYLLEEPTRRIARESTVPLPDDWMDLDDRQQELLNDLRDRLKFFHWELEFPDVFNPQRQGFDATIGNPPWEIEKPNSKEFFSGKDPLYRSYGKQHALDRQKDYFESDPSIEREWVEYNADYKSLSNWCKNRAHPYGDAKFRDHDGVKLNLADYSYWWSRQSDPTHKMGIRQRDARTGFADPEHPFQHQGSADTNSYKLFLEMARALQDDAGRLGFVVPSGLYTDYGTQELRDLFINQSRWEWLFSYENKNGLFDIHRSFKFCPIILEKGGQTDRIRASFMHHDIADWADADDHVLDYPRERILQFSPNTQSILEIRSERDLEILEKIYDNGVLLGDDSDEGWGIEYNREFDMTNDSDKFGPRPEFEEKGYRPDEYGHWLKGDWRPIEDFGFNPAQHRTDPHREHWLIQDRPEGLILSQSGKHGLIIEDLNDIALPLIEGRMLNRFDFSEKGWVSGKGRSADWREVAWSRKDIEPQFLIARKHCDKVLSDQISKIPHMRVGAATNTRSAKATIIPRLPSGDTAAIFKTGKVGDDLTVTAALNSFIFDFVMRVRLGGLHLDYHVFEPNPLPQPTADTFRRLSKTIVASLSFAHSGWSHLTQYVEFQTSKPWRKHWATASAKRMRLQCILDSLVATSFDVEFSDFSRILSDCDHPMQKLRDRQFRHEIYPKGFWRVDKEKPPELRHTVLTQVAFQDLEWLIDRMGDRDRAIATFAGQQHLLGAPVDSADVPDHPHIDADEGWMLPEELTLAEYDLGHDDRAKEPQPVASELGPRYYDWQLAQDPEESWEECRQHAELLEKIVPTPDREEKTEEGSAQGQQELITGE